jgi:membrane protease YdiL (CAAX protease family)
MTVRSSAHTLGEARDAAEQELDEAAEETPLETPSTASIKYSLLLGAMSIVWGVMMSQFGQGQIYWIMGPYAVLVSVVLLTLRSRALLRLLRPSTRNVSLGVSIGVAMTLATYPAFAAAQALFPELMSNVSQLYSQSRQEALVIAVTWVIVIAAAEELVWRGAWIEALTPRFGRFYAGAMSIGIYAAAQLCSKSFIVGLLALCCGTIWTVMRHYTRSIVSPLLAHLIWTPTVILLWPVV